MSPHEDAVRDALSLIEAVHRRDGEGRRVILDHGDNRMTALCLATIAADLLTDLSEWWQSPPSDLLARLREHHAKG